MLSYEMRLRAISVEMEKIIKVTLIAFIPATKFIFNQFLITLPYLL